MSQDDDPFGLQNDAGRTRIKPVNPPRAKSAGPRDAEMRPVSRVEEAPIKVRHTRSGQTPLVSAFSMLLGIAPELERATQPENPETLNARFYDNIVYSRDSAVSEGATLERAEQAAWLVAATLDDIVLNTPWGASSSWPSNPLVTKLSGDVAAGERYFEVVEHLMRHPDRDPEMLELAYYGLTLGFQGRYRVQGSAGAATIAQLRMRISRLLTRREAEDLSPRWHGVEAPDERPRFSVPIWAIPVFAAAVLVVVYAGLNFGLQARAGALTPQVTNLPPAEPARLYRPPIEQPEEAEVVSQEPVPQVIPQVTSFDFVPLIRAAAPGDLIFAASLSEDDAITLISLQSRTPNFFSTGSDQVDPRFGPLMATITQILTENIDQIAGVTVVGHTDSRGAVQNNQRLSEARAATVAGYITAAGFPDALVTTRGDGPTDPIADNGTAEGRAANRRVEIYIFKRS